MHSRIQALTAQLIQTVKILAKNKHGYCANSGSPSAFADKSLMTFLQRKKPSALHSFYFTKATTHKACKTLCSHSGHSLSVHQMPHGPLQFWFRRETTTTTSNLLSKTGNANLFFLLASTILCHALDSLYSQSHSSRYWHRKKIWNFMCKNIPNLHPSGHLNKKKTPNKTNRNAKF